MIANDVDASLRAFKVTNTKFVTASWLVTCVNAVKNYNFSFDAMEECAHHELDVSGLLEPCMNEAETTQDEGLMDDIFDIDFGVRTSPIPTRQPTTLRQTRSARTRITNVSTSIQNLSSSEVETETIPNFADFDENLFESHDQEENLDDSLHFNVVQQVSTPKERLEQLFQQKADLEKQMQERLENESVDESFARWNEFNREITKLFEDYFLHNNIE